jgi:hypothetical protein
LKRVHNRNKRKLFVLHNTSFSLPLLAKRHFKRTKIAQELLVTEGTYVKNLAITIKVLSLIITQSQTHLSNVTFVSCSLFSS